MCASTCVSVCVRVCLRVCQADPESAGNFLEMQSFTAVPRGRPNKPQMCGRICPLLFVSPPLYLQRLQKHIRPKTKKKKKRGIRGQGRGEGGGEERGRFLLFQFFNSFAVSCHRSPPWGGSQMFIMYKREEKRNHKLFHDASKVTSSDP